MRSSNTDAGSSVGSCGTSWPENAAARIDRRRDDDRSFHDRDRDLRHGQSHPELASSSATISRCSSLGASGTGNALQRGAVQRSQGWSFACRFVANRLSPPGVPDASRRIGARTGRLQPRPNEHDSGGCSGRSDHSRSDRAQACPVAALVEQDVAHLQVRALPPSSSGTRIALTSSRSRYPRCTLATRRNGTSTKSSSRSRFGILGDASPRYRQSRQASSSRHSSDNSNRSRRCPPQELESRPSRDHRGLGGVEAGEVFFDGGDDSSLFGERGDRDGHALQNVWLMLRCDGRSVDHAAPNAPAGAGAVEEPSRACLDSTRRVQRRQIA